MVRRKAGWVAAWATAALAALGAAQAGGCFQASGLGDITFAAPDGGAGGTGAGGTSTGGMPSHDGGAKCTSAAECDDKDPCTTDACTAGHCEHTPEPDGTACTAGGSPGKCSGGKCESSGCLNGNVCPSMGPCQTGTCNGATGNCEYTNVPDGTPTPGVTPVAGDCKQHICLAGKDTDANDDADLPTLPAAMAGCADAKCNNGTPELPLHMTGSPCSTWMGTMPGFCDATGACVQCAEDSDCPGASTDCQHPACMNATCMQVFASSGTPTTSNPPQVSGDCQQIVCDGMGATKTIADSTDVPSDPTGCNPGVCNGTTPAHMEAPNGTTCLGGCGAAISCNLGRCMNCTMDCQCQDGGKFPNGKCQSFLGCQCTPSTCAALGLTCGTAPDGCGGTLDCSNGNKNGSETDVDCGGPVAACAARCAQGKHCSATTDCASGLTCADGVCCNQACTGACEACTAAKKGQGADGVCGAVAAGQADPHGVCAAQPVATCGQTGTCDGSGACSTWPSGTVCVPASCMGSVLTKAESCAGGACKAQVPATQSCAPYACSAGACQTSCTQDAQCGMGNYCSSGMCVPQISQGTACTAGDQCKSGFCAGGVCCDKACSGQCQACSAALTGGTDGTCADVTAGMPDPSGTCVMEPATSCGTDGNCAAGGTCEDYASGASCGTTCSGAQLTVRTCDGTGVCNGTPAACPGNFRCASGTACATSCTTGTSQCANGFYCDGGMCVSSNAGAACVANSDCSSFLCLGGFCCVSNQCSKGGGGGTCGGNACAAGTGACNAAPALTSCGPTSCVTGTEARDYVCDGMGACQQVTIMCPTTCTSGKCANCVADADCSQFGWCDAGACMPKGQSGATCAAADQCLSAVCTTGKCQ